MLYIVLYDHFGFSVTGVIFTLLATSLLIVSFIDLAYRIIPDVVTLPGIVAGLLAQHDRDVGGLWQCVAWGGDRRRGVPARRHSQPWRHGAAAISNSPP